MAEIQYLGQTTRAGQSNHRFLVGSTSSISLAEVIGIVDAARDQLGEAEDVSGPDFLAVRRRVTQTSEERRVGWDVLVLWGINVSALDVDQRHNLEGILRQHSSDLAQLITCINWDSTPSSDWLYRLNELDDWRAALPGRLPVVTLAKPVSKRFWMVTTAIGTLLVMGLLITKGLDHRLGQVGQANHGDQKIYEHLQSSEDANVPFDDFDELANECNNNNNKIVEADHFRQLLCHTGKESHLKPAIDKLKEICSEKDLLKIYLNAWTHFSSEDDFTKKQLKDNWKKESEGLQTLLKAMDPAKQVKWLKTFQEVLSGYKLELKACKKQKNPCGATGALLTECDAEAILKVRKDLKVGKTTDLKNKLWATMSCFNKDSPKYISVAYVIDKCFSNREVNIKELEYPNICKIIDATKKEKKEGDENLAKILDILMKIYITKTKTLTECNL